MHRRRSTALAGLAALLALPLLAAVPAVADPPGELAPGGGHPAANAQASDRVVYQYDRSTSADRAAKPGRPGSSPNMTFHGGKIVTTAVIRPIFWGTTWASYSGDKTSGIDSWYAGYSNSNYAKTTIEYTGSNGTVGANVTSAAHLTDTSAASGGSNTSVILNEVAHALSVAGIPPDPAGNGYYPVYTDLPRGHAGYCAWHSSGTIGGTPVQFAFFWNLDGDPGCDPQDTSGQHSQGLAAIANVSGHELAEAMTDPASPGAWYDGQGYENGDKCAWTFGAPLLSFSNGTQWKVQGEWSNAAYTAQKGYPNSSGQKGCLSGL
jgi:hypothetical protein